jgi:hypothetical protein
MVLVASTLAGAPAAGGAALLRCNGSPKLCDRSLGDVAFATSHNSMSSAADGFRGPNQGATVPEQLRQGIRGFQIDAYPGVRRQGRVYTDLPGTFGDQATDLPRPLVALAKQIHRRLGAPPADAPTDVYLCHTFCEIGATRMSKFADDLRTFLDSHPRVVLTAVIEDYMPPEELRRVFDGAGLTPMLLAVDPTKPLPTLGEMIRAGTRLQVSLENGDGGPTLPNAFTGLVEETPFTFLTTTELRRAASCSANRGPAEAPVFQLNHWVTPAGRRRSIAVNSSVLRARVRECTEVRGRPPTLVAVDFAEEGDVIDVVDGLNE